MEAIPKDVVLKAEEFFLSLSFISKKNQIRFLYHEQPELMQLFCYDTNIVKEVNVAENCEYLYTIIYDCYKNYGVNLPIIPIEDTFEAMKSLLGSFIMKEGENPSLEKMKEYSKNTVKQDNLIDYIIAKIDETKYNPVFYSKQLDLRRIFVQLYTFILILDNEMKKHIGDEVN